MNISPNNHVLSGKAKELAGYLVVDDNYSLYEDQGKYFVIHTDCPNLQTYSPREVSHSEAKAFIERAGPKGLCVHVVREDLIRIGFSENRADDLISELANLWPDSEFYSRPPSPKENPQPLRNESIAERLEDLRQRMARNRGV